MSACICSDHFEIFLSNFNWDEVNGKANNLNPSEKIPADFSSKKGGWKEFLRLLEFTGYQKLEWNLTSSEYRSEMRMV